MKMYKYENGALVEYSEADIAQAEADRAQSEALASQLILDSALAKRNKLLVDSDWTQLPDVPLTDDQKLAWQNYRQSLRDMTDQPEWPNDPVWPVPPA